MDVIAANLIGWMDEDEAIQAMGTPPFTEQARASLSQAWQSKARAVEARSTSGLPPLEEVVGELPGEMKCLAEKFHARPDAAPFSETAGWAIKLVDLAKLISFQKTIFLAGWIDAIARAKPAGPADLFDLCFPSAEWGPPLLAMADESAFTYSSDNPNLRVGRRISQNCVMPTGHPEDGRNFRVVGFEVTFGNPFVKAMQVDGRVILRDGYHRCFGLFAQGIAKVPCLLQTGHAKDVLPPNRPGFVGLKRLMGPRPPHLADFTDESVSHVGQRRAIRKVVRVSADEFYVEA